MTAVVTPFADVNGDLDVVQDDNTIDAAAIVMPLVAPTTFSWGAKGSNIALSNGSKDATESSGSNWGLVRGSFFNNVGLRYFEIEVLVSNGCTAIGISDDTTPAGAGLTDLISCRYSGAMRYNGESFFTFYDPVNGFINDSTSYGYGTIRDALLAGDRLGVAVDFTHKEVYFSRAGIWFAGSDPIARLNPRLTWTGTKFAVYPFVAIGLGDSVRLHGGATQAYPLPVGYLAWDDRPPAVGTLSVTQASQGVLAESSYYRTGMLAVVQAPQTLEATAVGPQAPPPLPPSPITYTGDRHVTRSGDDYAVAMEGLLPQGQAWPRAWGSVLMNTVRGLTRIWGDFEIRASHLLEQESDPRKTVELLPDWERNWGLPDPCYSEPQTLYERQLALLMRMTMLGSQSREFFIWLAATIGYIITISEFRVWVVGLDRCGDSRTIGSLPPDPNRNEWQQELLDPRGSHLDDGEMSAWPSYGLGPPENRYYWTVRVDQAKIVWFRVTASQCGVDPHVRIGFADDLECLLNRYKPGHTKIIFDYGGLQDNPSMAGTP
jgi:uncharacterized protein YmfQ (DUF2313 family)